VKEKKKKFYPQIQGVTVDSLECVLPELADLSPVPISLMADAPDITSSG
jgi:hypothetical protein